MIVDSMVISYSRPMFDLFLRRIVANVVNIFGVSTNPSVIIMDVILLSTKPFVIVFMLSFYKPTHL